MEGGELKGGGVRMDGARETVDVGSSNGVGVVTRRGVKGGVSDTDRRAIPSEDCTYPSLAISCDLRLTGGRGTPWRGSINTLGAWLKGVLNVNLFSLKLKGDICEGDPIPLVASLW